MFTRQGWRCDCRESPTNTHPAVPLHRFQRNRRGLAAADAQRRDSASDAALFHRVGSVTISRLPVDPIG